eukprot:jgi/Hompol1/3740/HPOL_003335-RA
MQLDKSRDLGRTVYVPEACTSTEYSKFSSSIERALQSFDSVSEWQDVIGFLTRLAKILSQYQQFTTIPKKLIVSKRLAQCLNPALPAGVHTKALEVYHLIFQSAGKAQLAEDLPLWSYGLFPFGSHAAMSVKFHLMLRRTGGSHAAQSAIADLQLIIFTLENFKFADEETIRVHLPFMYQTVAFSLAAQSFKLNDTLNPHYLSDEQYSESSLIEHLRLNAKRLQLCLTLAHVLHNDIFSSTWTLQDYRGTSSERRSRHSAHHTQLDRMQYECTVSDISKVYDLADSTDPTFRDWLNSVLVGKPRIDASINQIVAFSIAVAQDHIFISSTSHAPQLSDTTTLLSSATLSTRGLEDLYSNSSAYLTSSGMADQIRKEIYILLSEIFVRHATAGTDFSTIDPNWLHAYLDCSTLVGL